MQFFGIFQWAQIIGNLLAGILLARSISDFWLFLILTVIGSTSIIGFLALRYLSPSSRLCLPLRTSLSAHITCRRPKAVASTTEETFSTRITQTFSIMVTKQMALLYCTMIYSGVRYLKIFYRYFLFIYFIFFYYFIFNLFLVCSNLVIVKRTCLVCSQGQDQRNKSDIS